MTFDYDARLRLRRVFGVIVPAALLGLAVWCAQGFPTLVAPADQAEEQEGDIARAAPVPSESAPPSDAPTDQPSDPAPTSIPVPPADPPSDPGSPSGTAVAGLPDGPGTTEPGIYVSATPTVDGTLDVSEVVWLPEPTDEVTLRPRDVHSAGPAFLDNKVIASKIRLTTDGQAVQLGSSVVAGPQRVMFSRSVQRFELHYVLSGATVRSTPSTAGRGSAALGPLTGIDSDVPVVVWTIGRAVRNIQCPLLLPLMQSCAAGDPAALRTLPGLRSPTALVVLQLDLLSAS